MTKEKKTLAIWIPVFVAVLGGIGYLITRYLESPSALLGFVDDPPGPVRVVLDNGPEEEEANYISGFFRFEDVPTGTHHLLFENSDCWPQAVIVDVRSPGDNVLGQRVRLVRRSDSEAAPPVQRMAVAALPTRTSDGRAPLLSRVAAQVLATVFATAETNRTGWVNLGAFDDEAWTERRIEVGETLPPVGNKLEVTADQVLWSQRPSRRLFFGGYDLGRVHGIVRPGDRLEVSALKTDVGQNQVWVQVRVQPSEKMQL